MVSVLVSSAVDRGF